MARQVGCFKTGRSTPYKAGVTPLMGAEAEILADDDTYDDCIVPRTTQNGRSENYGDGNDLFGYISPKRIVHTPQGVRVVEEHVDPRIQVYQAMGTMPVELEKQGEEKMASRNITTRGSRENTSFRKTPVQAAQEKQAMDPQAAALGAIADTLAALNRRMDALEGREPVSETVTVTDSPSGAHTTADKVRIPASAADRMVARKIDSSMTAQDPYEDDDLFAIGPDDTEEAVDEVEEENLNSVTVRYYGEDQEVDVDLPILQVIPSGNTVLVTFTYDMNEYEFPKGDYEFTWEGYTYTLRYAGHAFIDGSLVAHLFRVLDRS